MNTCSNLPSADNVKILLIYSTSLTLDFSFDRSDEHPLDVFEDIFASYEMRK